MIYLDTSVALAHLMGEDRVPLTRALEPFPAPVRTLDALHLATAEFLRTQGQPLQLATYDVRMADVAERLGIPLVLR